jgi:hypothetical protein
MGSRAGESKCRSNVEATQLLRRVKLASFRRAIIYNQMVVC